MRITLEREYKYLLNKSTDYRAGWLACRDNLIPANTQYTTEFDEGYSDCYANSQTSSEAFDYVEGI